jgi:hypothetical protein
VNQAAYAIASARVELLIEELRVALAKREADRAKWADMGCLTRVVEDLAALVEEVRKA